MMYHKHKIIESNVKELFKGTSDRFIKDQVNQSINRYFIFTQENYLLLQNKNIILDEELKIKLNQL